MAADNAESPEQHVDAGTSKAEQKPYDRLYDRDMVKKIHSTWESFFDVQTAINQATFHDKKSPICAIREVCASISSAELRNGQHASLQVKDVLPPAQANKLAVAFMQMEQDPLNLDRYGRRKDMAESLQQTVRVLREIFAPEIHDVYDKMAKTVAGKREKPLEESLFRGNNAISFGR